MGLQNTCSKCGKSISGAGKTGMCQSCIMKGRIPKNLAIFKAAGAKANLGRHHTEEWKKKMSEKMKKIGNKPPSSKGRKLSEETKRKIGEKSRMARLREKKAGRDFAALAKANFGEPKYGKENFAWKENKKMQKGGFQKMVRDLYLYREWRLRVFERDFYTCQLCNTKEGELHADHYPIPFNELLKRYEIKTLDDALVCKELWKIENGRVLCRNCHKKSESWGKK